MAARQGPTPLKYRQLERCQGARIVLPPVVRATICKIEVLLEQDCEFHETRKMLLPPLVGSRFVLHSNATAGHDWSPRWAQIVLSPLLLTPVVPVALLLLAVLVKFVLYTSSITLPQSLSMPS